MFGEVVLGTAPRQALRIPADAVIDSGTRSVVFVALGDGKFQPRVVRLGASDGDHVEVLDGLAAGEQIVTRANFLVDSESRLKASLQALERGPVGHDQGDHPLQRRQPVPGHRRHPGRRWRAPGGRCGTSRSTRCRTSPTRRSSSTRSGTGARTSSRTRSPTRSPRRCSARPRVKAIRGLLRLRLQLRLRHLRGRHRHLLGAHPRARVPLQDPAAAAGRGDHRARPRRHQRRLGLPVRPGGPERHPLLRRAAQLPGLEPALRRAERPRRLRGGHRGRPGPPVPDHRQPERPGRLQAAARGGHQGGAARQQRRGRPAGRALRPRVHGPRPRLREVASPTSSSWCCKAEGGHPGHREGRGHGGARARDAPRHRRPRRPGRRGRRHRGDALGRERPQRHRPGQGQSWRSSSPRCPRASRWSPPTTAPSSSTRPSRR